MLSFMRLCFFHSNLSLSAIISFQTAVPIFITYMKQCETVGSQSQFVIKATYVTIWHAQQRLQIETAYNFSHLHY
jgi:hypothetical protein